MYFAIKTIHQTAALISIAGFLIRGIWMLIESEKLQQRWVRIIPHAVDTVLLGSAITLAIITTQYPIEQSWLTAKVAALLLYIGLGLVAFRFGKTKLVKTTAWVAAILVFSYIMMVAIIKQPLFFT